MGLKLKFSIHPLFILFGIYFAFCGKVFSFLIYTFTAVLHEFGHYCQAEKLGYKLVKLQLLPYGAVISGDLEGLRFKDEVAVALAGPITNLTIALFFLALWWLFPELYPFTDTAMQANLSLGLINLIPAYPLDGGRVLRAGLSRVCSRKTALTVSLITALLLAVGLLGLFVYSIIAKSLNFSLLFFALFILVGAFSRGKDNIYVKYYAQFDGKKLKRGMEVQVLAFSESATVKDLLQRVKGEALYEVRILDDRGKIKRTFSPKAVLEVISSHGPYEKLDKII
ncbi:MAG: hypothetical protein IJW47_00940 [Clostridia bacterium]|nr:hypothetical protein [Clostridia bacterium]